MSNSTVSILPSSSTSRQSLRAARLPSLRHYATGAEPSAAVSPNSEPASPPPPQGDAPSSSSASSSAAPVDPKLSAIVDQIENLTLLQASELVSQLKSRLNIQDIAMPSAGAAAPAAPAAGAAGEQEEEAAAKPAAKTTFTLKLKSLSEPTAKAKVIKEVKLINPNMNLVEAKKFVESAPQTLKEGLNKEELEKLQKAMEAAGAVVEVE